MVMVFILSQGCLRGSDYTRPAVAHTENVPAGGVPLLTFPSALFYRRRRTGRPPFLPAASQIENTSHTGAGPSPLLSLYSLPPETNKLLPDRPPSLELGFPATTTPTPVVHSVVPPSGSNHTKGCLLLTLLL